MATSIYLRAVKDYSIMNYDKGGWDYIAECWSDDEICDAIKGARSIKGAIEKMARVAGIYVEQQAETRFE